MSKESIYEYELEELVLANATFPGDEPLDIRQAEPFAQAEPFERDAPVEPSQVPTDPPPPPPG